MHEMIDLCPYLPERKTRIRPVPRRRTTAADFLLALEAVVTAVIGVSVVIGIAAFVLML